MKVNTLSDREVKLADSMDGIETINMIEMGYPKSMTLMLFLKVKGQEMYCAVSSARSVVKEFKSFNTLYAFIHTRCPRYVKQQMERGHPLMTVNVIKQKPQVEDSLAEEMEVSE